jgi:hypothetical protein
MRRSSPEWNVLLAPFESLFTKPGYRYFCAFVLVFAHMDQRLWVTQVVLCGFVNRHFTRFYRFLKEGAWTTEAVSQRVWSLCSERCVGEGGRLFAAIDDTVAAKWGKHFEALGVHHDPMNRHNPKRLSSGHCFVCLAALAEQTAEHFVGLFVGAALYLQEKACQEGQVFRTKLELALGLTLSVASPPEVVVVAVADGAYAKKAFVFPVCQAGRHVLSRLRSDTVFYDLPPVKKKGQKGRPRRYGAKHKAAEWAHKDKGWRRVTLRLYGKEAHLHLKTRVVLQRTLGVKIRIVAVRWAERRLVFLFCSDVTLTAEEIVRFYSARFAIETGFRDAKQNFGFSTYQVRSKASILRVVHLCLWAQTLLRLRCWDARPEPVFGEWRKPLSYLTLSQQKRWSQQRQEAICAGSTEMVGVAEKTEPLPLAT